METPPSNNRPDKEKFDDSSVFGRATDRNNAPKKGEDNRIERLGVAFIGLGFLASAAAAGFSGWQASISNQTMIGDQRAWVALDHIAFEASQADPVGQGNDVIKFIVSYQNIGKSPALDIGENVVLNTTVSDAFKRPRDNPYEPEVLGPYVAFGEHNPACDKIEPISGGKTIYPAIHAPYETLWSKKFGSTVPLMEGKEVLIIYGCFAYRSFRVTRTTAFCYYPEPTPGAPFKQWPLKLCPNSGNYAN